MVDHRLSGGSSSPSQNVIEARFQLNVVLVNVVIQIFSAQNFGYSHQLQKNRDKRTT